jgi:8-oxo-dGTP diphosphatase
MMSRDSTLCFLVRKDPPDEAQVLLGFKKIGFGAGKYTGFGGKVEDGETVAVAAVRELEEETGVTVLEKDLQLMGHLTFLFPAKPDWSQVVYAFVTTRWNGNPVESVEMMPAWFPVNGIPYEGMWQDAAYWLPRILVGERVRARFSFKGDNETIDELEVEAYV